MADAQVQEGADATADFTVTLSRAVSQTVTVDWATADGTATAGQDYTAANGTLTFRPGETSKTVSITILDDSVEDDGETFTLRLSNASGATIADAEATGAINNDESGQQIASENEPPSGLPSITGTAEVGQTLTASTSGISDADGLTSATYIYQWIRVDGGTETDISGATGSTYTLTAADMGKTVKVRVMFTDDAGNEEGPLTSDAYPACRGLCPDAVVSEPVVAPLTCDAIWCASLSAVTVADELAVGYLWNLGELTDTDFVIDGTTYTIRALLARGVGLNFGVSPELPAALRDALVLHVGTTQYAFGDSIRSILSEGVYLYTWRIPTNWEAGEAVTGLRLTRGVTTTTVSTPLTARYENMPESHDGTSAFTFDLHFSEDIGGLSYRTVRDDALELTGGRVTKARRLTQGSNHGWRVTVEPTSSGDIAISLPARACSKTGAICTGDGRQLSSRAESTVAGPASANSPATGLPVISGTARVGEMLTVSTSGIADTDGLDNVTFSYQWMRNDGSTDTDIAGATQAYYALVSADQGNAIRVRVAFTDDGGTEETLTSAATAAVIVPLTASIESIPETHDGETAFTFELRFSEEIDISYVTLRDSAFEVSGGSVTGARRLEQGKNQRWEITVEPNTGDLTIALLAGPACGEPNAICTAGGKQLSRRLEGTVPGPASTTATEEPAPTTVTRTLWSSTLTVGEQDWFGFIGAGNGGSLSSTGWSENGRDHEVGRVDLALYPSKAYELWVEFTPVPENIDDLTLHVDDTALPLSDAVRNGRRFAWMVGELAWEAGDRVFLRLGRTVEVEAPEPGLSAADAEVREGPDASLEFPITLTPASNVEVTVSYATSDGTATAGEDYKVAEGTLVFAPGETRNTVSVAVLDDAHDEGMETLTLTLSNASGAAIASGSAMGRIVNSDPMPQAWLARFGRTVASQAVGAIGSRLEGGGGTHVSVAGQSLDLTDGPMTSGDRWTARLETESFALTDESGWTMTGREVLLGSSFQLSAGGEAGVPAWTAWRQGATGGFEADVEGVHMDGSVTSGFLGADVGAGRWLAGVALSLSEGEGDYALSDGEGRGDVKSSLTAIYPYARLGLTDAVDVWGLVGYGTGELTLTQNPETDRVKTYKTDISMRMGAVGARGEVLSPSEPGGLSVAVKSDAFWVRTSSEAVSGSDGNLAASEADVTRMRLLVEGSRSFETGGGALTPSLELGLRHDGGDREKADEKVSGRDRAPCPRGGSTIPWCRGAVRFHPDEQSTRTADIHRRWSRRGRQIQGRALGQSHRAYA